MIMAGGTGGHIFPALSVAEVLRSKNIAVTWLGTRAGIEMELVPAKNFPIDYIDVEGLRGAGIMKWLRAPYIIVRAIFQALAVIRKESPDVILGLGGFVSGPGGIAARILGLPLVIHEQNAIAGTTNKLLAKVANRVLTAFPNTLTQGEWVGNPVRSEIIALQSPLLSSNRETHPLRILVLGGSLGAITINHQIPLALATIGKPHWFEVRHQSGKKHLKPFIADMAGAYKWADVVICRAGALTISELTTVGIGALLIPFPYAVDDHQTRNGEWLVQHGAAIMIKESDLTTEGLASILNEWLGDRSNLISMAINSRRLAKVDATDLVVDICMEVA
ncbi:MAG: undecaprenyldiphospho-muramoylpentapeptide beta-N-acetylglucosaminyltransferase [Pseudomonadales bacterium]